LVSQKLLRSLCTLIFPPESYLSILNLRLRNQKWKIIQGPYKQTKSIFKLFRGETSPQTGDNTLVERGLELVSLSTPALRDKKCGVQIRSQAKGCGGCTPFTLRNSKDITSMSIKHDHLDLTNYEVLSKLELSRNQKGCSTCKLVPYILWVDRCTAVPGIFDPEFSSAGNSAYRLLEVSEELNIHPKISELWFASLLAVEGC
jgi:hypothetical protein